jgi:hypothetical protein
VTSTSTNISVSWFHPTKAELFKAVSINHFKHGTIFSTVDVRDLTVDHRFFFETVQFGDSN